MGNMGRGLSVLSLAFEGDSALKHAGIWASSLLGAFLANKRDIFLRPSP